MNKRRRNRIQTEGKVGWRVDEWTDAVGCCRATTNNLITNKIVRSVKIGSMRIILERPADFLARAAEAPITIQPPKPAAPSAPRGRPRKYLSPASAPAPPVPAAIDASSSGVDTRAQGLRVLR